MAVKKYKIEIIIFCIVFAVGGLFLGLKISKGLPVEALASEQDGYFILANNLYHYGVFSLSPDLSPTNLRVPGYPFFLTVFYALFRNWWAVLFLQIGLLAAAAVLIYRIGLMTMIPKKLALIFSLFFGLEPYTIDIYMQFFSDNLFLLFLLLSVFVFCKYLERPETKKICWLAVLYACLLYTKPVSLYLLAVISIIVFFWYFLGKKSTERYFQNHFSFLKTFLIFSLILAGLIFPWILRNKIVLNVFDLSYDHVAILYGSALQFDAFEQGIAFPVPDINAPLLRLTTANTAGQRFSDSLKIILHHPLDFSVLFSKYFVSAIIQSNWPGAASNLFFGRSGQVNYDWTVLNPILNAGFPGFLAFPPERIIYFALMIFGGGFWLCINVLMFFGFYGLWRRKDDLTKPKALLLLFLPIFFMATGALTFGDVVRYRLAATPYIFILAGHGFLFISHYFHEMSH